MLLETLEQGFLDPNHVFLERDSSEEIDSSEDATLRLISQMLMEEDGLENKPCMLQQSLALQATERSFYHVLGQKYPLDENQFNWVKNTEKIERSPYPGSTFESVLHSRCSKKCPNEVEKTANLAQHTNHTKKSLKRDNLPNGSGDDEESVNRGQRNKQLASSKEGLGEKLDMYDEVLLCPLINPHLHSDHSLCFDQDLDDSSKKASTKVRQNGTSRERKCRNKREHSNKEVVDLTTLLIQCAQAVSISNTRNADEILKKIRKHSSPYGDGYERAAYYFANALEARMAGTGTELYSAFHNSFRLISTVDVLKGYQLYVKASPFNKMSNMFGNRSIAKVAEKAKRVHIIDFGIMYGFQYPCLIQHLSARSGGPLKLRITGIDFPQPGFRPAERIEETGCRLAMYCKRFNVPFKYTAIAKKWETIELEDLKIEKDEVLVVNSLYRLRNVLDETGVESSPRDDVFNLVKKINPDLFIHGALNATYSVPFFVTRFKDALFNFCARFDMFEANVAREEHRRFVFEREIYGRDIMNVVACEGSERIERPESYKKWQIRILRAGFRQVELDKEIVKNVRAMVKAHYHKDYVVDEDGNWLLQGWKGKIIYATSCWKPVN